MKDFENDFLRKMQGRETSMRTAAQQPPSTKTMIHSSMKKSSEEMEKSGIKSIITEITGLKNVEEWSVIDCNEEKGLYLIHSNIEPKKKGLPRGTVMDVHAKTIVCDSFGFTPTAPLDCLFIQPKTQNIVITDEYLVKHTFSKETCTICPAYEGVVVRVFKHDGVVYFSTHKKLDCCRSRWGKSETFLDIYKRLGGPTAEQLFPEDILTSPWCYTFLLVDKSLLVATKQTIGVGYMVYLGVQQMWSLEDGECPYLLEGKKHLNPTKIEVEENPLKFKGRETPFMVQPYHLTLDEANDFLKWGYASREEAIANVSSDGKARRPPPASHLCLGESVIVYQHEDSGKVVDSVRVQSTGYHWRQRKRGDNPNIRHRFYQLLTDALKSPIVQGRLDAKMANEFLSKYPFFYRESLNTIRALHGGQYIRLDLRELDDRLFLVYISFLNSLPDAYKEEGAQLLEEFKKDRQEVISWIQKIAVEKYRKSRPPRKRKPEERENPPVMESPEKELTPPEEETERVLSQRLQDILRLAKEYAVERKKRGRDKNKNGKRMSEGYLIKINIQKLLYRETGPSLFRLVREMRREERLAAQESSESVCK